MSIIRHRDILKVLAILLLLFMISPVCAEVVDRGQYWNKIDNNDGTFTLESSESMNYYNGTDYAPINITFIQDCEQGYDYCVETGIYQAQFKSSSAGTNVAKYILENSSVSYTPYKLQYTGNNKQSLISNSQNVDGFADENKFTYPELYGEGFDLSFTYQTTRLKEELIIDDEDDLPNPPNNLGNNPQLSLEFKIRIDNLDAENHNTKVKWNKVDDFTVDGQVNFKDANNVTLFFLPQAYAYDSAGERIDLIYTFKKAGINLFVSIKTPYSWLEDDDREYPVYIDPTTALSSSASSAASKNGNADTNFGDANYIAVGKSQAVLGEIRTFIMFNISEIPDNINITSALMNLWLYDDNTESSSRVINTHRVTSEWREDEVTWNERRLGIDWVEDGGDFDSTIISSKTISANPDDAWYSWDLTELTTEWYNETYDNYGVVLKKQDSQQWEHRFYSDEFTANPGLAPKLFVNYTLIELAEEPSDVDAPAVDIIYPINTTYDTNVTELNYTASDDNLESCWYSLDSGLINTTVTCTQNVTNLLSNEGSNTWTIWANDSSGNSNSSSITFTVDTTAPQVSIISPNGTYNLTDIELNYTVTDASIFNCTYNVSSENDTIIVDTQIADCANTNFSVNNTSANYTLDIKVTDVANNLATVSTNFSVYINETNDTEETSSSNPYADSGNSRDDDENSEEVVEEEEVEDLAELSSAEPSDTTEQSSAEPEGETEEPEGKSGFELFTGALLGDSNVELNKTSAAYVSVSAIILTGLYILVKFYFDNSKHKTGIRKRKAPWFRRGVVLDFSPRKRSRISYDIDRSLERRSRLYRELKRKYFRK